MTSKSAAKLIPNDPSKVMVIRDLTPQVTTFSVPFARFGHVKVGGRGTLVKLQTGSLAIFSPVALTPEVKAKVAQQGQVKYIVAPDFEHHIFVSPWSKEYPDAQVIGVEGLPEKREKDDATKGVPFAHVFTQGNKRDVKISPEFDAEFDYEYFHSHINKELVFLHRPSRTMIEADLMFNLPATEQYSKTGVDAGAGVLTKLFSSVWNLRGEMTAQRRFLWYMGSGGDRKGFADSVKRISDWEYDRVVPCHGDVVETGGKNVMSHLLAWFKQMQ